MDTLAAAVVVFLASSLVVILAGIGLARYGDELAEHTGWGTLWVGTILVSISTSLPELTVNITAVWLENAPDLALGNVYGANMLNVVVLSLIGLAFGIRGIFGQPGRATRRLAQVAIVLVAIAAVMGATGDVALGRSSAGGLLVAVAYLAGMRAVYNAGRPATSGEEDARGRGSARGAWIGFVAASLVVIVAGRFLASSANSIAEITGISASFIGVLLVAMVTTLPESSVSAAAAWRRSYGIAVGNVYGSCAFNVFIFSFADLASPAPLLRFMEGEHFVAAAAALVLMAMGLLIMRTAAAPTLALARGLASAVPLLYVVALYVVFTMAQR